MAISITITLSSAGTDTGPNFTLFCPTGTVTPFTASKSELLLGKTVVISDDNASQVHVISNGTCTNTLVIDIPQLTTTSTTTTTTTIAPTTTTSTTTTTTTSAQSVTIYYNAQSPGAGTGYLYYKIDSGSWTSLSATFITCSGTLSTVINVPSGSTLYLGVRDGSDVDIQFAGDTSTTCSSPTTYCGITTPYSQVITVPTSLYLSAGWSGGFVTC